MGEYNKQQEVMPIAIIGMSCRFPGGSTNPSKLWEMLSQGRSAWSEFPLERFNQDAFYHPQAEMQGTFNSRGAHFLEENPLGFDAQFFNISPAEAVSMDPQQRYQLEVVYEALENAGIPLDTLKGSRTAVLMSLFNKDYESILQRDPDFGPRYEVFGNGAAMLSNRVSYYFDLRGPSITLDTGCSGGLVALHQACQSIRVGEADQALVGGANMILDPNVMISMKYFLIASYRFFSGDGRCYTFDSRGSGYGRGEGVACVMLKRLDHAVAAGDPIRAVIRNSAVNQDGKTQGITVPNGNAQEDLIRSAYADAGIDPQTTGYFEAHGTGTILGDPIEAQAIAATIGKAKQPQTPLYVGSIKTNIGHLESVSGLAGVLKAVLALEHAQIPPQVNFEKPNERLRLDEWNLQIPRVLEAWPYKGTRRASVNSFGYGGTNAHLILDDAYHYLCENELSSPQSALMPGSGGDVMRNGISHLSCMSSSHPRANGKTTTNGLDHQSVHDELPQCDNRTSEPIVEGQQSRLLLLTLSAKSKVICEEMLRNILEWLKHCQNRGQSVDIRELAFTLYARRSLFPWRIAIPAVDVPQAIMKMDSSGVVPHRIPHSPRLAFIFTGQGAQWQGMGCTLSRLYSVFDSSLSVADRLIRQLDAPWSVHGELFRSEKGSRMNQAAISQPLCIILQLALVDLLHSWNVFPSSVVGHSSGEIAAAYACGAITFASAVHIAYYRGLLSGELNKILPGVQGAMASVALSEEEVEAHLRDVPQRLGKVCIACVNSPSNVTVSGDRAAIMSLQSSLEARGIWIRKLVVDTAYHSHHMEAIVDRYLQYLSSLPEPDEGLEVSFISSVTGQQMSGASLNSAYWVRNMVSKVAFSNAIQSLCRGQKSKMDSTSWSPITTLVELGPHSALAGPLRQIMTSLPTNASEIRYLPSLVRREDAAQTITQLAGDLLTCGLSVDINKVNFENHKDRLKVLTELPTYPWDHSTQFCHESRISRRYRQRLYPRHNLLGVPSPDNNDLEPKWNNYLRLSENPWIRGHAIQASNLYPGSGFICMAVEASRQRAERLSKPISGFRLRNVGINRPLVVSEEVEDLEVSISFKPYTVSANEASAVWDEFHVSSYQQERGWIKHCSGLINVQEDSKVLDTEVTPGKREQQLDAQLELSQYRTVCSENVDTAKFFESMRTLGYDYQGPFRSITNIDTSDCQGLGSVRIPDTACQMPEGIESTHVVHPATLDSCCQMMFPPLLRNAYLRTTMVPTFIKEIYISNDMPRERGSELLVLSRIESSGPLGFDSNLMALTKKDGHCSVPLMEVEGVHCTPIGGVSLAEMTPLSDRRFCYEIDWRLDVKLLSSTDIIEMCKHDEATDVADDKFNRLCAASYFYIQNALADLNTTGEADMLQHHETYAAWMKSCGLPYFKDFESLISTKVDQVLPDADADEVMLHRIGPQLVAILRGQVDPLALMLEDDLLASVSACTEKRSQTSLSRYADLMSHTNPNMKALQIGVGTSSTTKALLQTLGGDGGVAGKGARLAQYDLTGVSSDVLEKAREHLKPWENMIRYRVFDVENEPQSQGFENGAYDLVVADNVFHTTQSIDHSLANAGRLLRPGGTLLMIEATRSISHLNVIFGTLPGWWSGIEDGRFDTPTLSGEQWNEKLLSNGFDGLEVCIPDHESDKGALMSFMVATASEDRIASQEDPLHVLYNGADKQTDMSALVQIFDLPWSCTSTLEILYNINGYCICMVESRQPLLHACSPEDFGKIKRLIECARGILWITRGASMESRTPKAALAAGLTRTVRAEYPAVRVVTLDLDPNRIDSPQADAKIIQTVFRRTMLQQNRSNTEHEFAERNGRIYVPRLYEKREINDQVQAVTVTPESETQNFFQPGRPLRLEIGSPGLLDSLRFNDSSHASAPLLADELRVELKAAGVNFRDAMVSLGQLGNNAPFSSECGAVVTEVGHDLSNQFKVGDRVCTSGGEGYSSSMRVKGLVTQIIPDEMDFATAASIPVVFTTAFYSLIHVARLEANEKILIHSAAGGVGQAAIMIAQYIGAEIFVTAGNTEKKRFLIENYGIAEDHIFSSRDSSFVPGIMKMTAKQGVDVILNSLAGELCRHSCTCIAPMGRFIELGKRDALTNTRLEMGFFDRNVTFASVDLIRIYMSKLALCGKILEDVFDLLRKGKVNPIKPIHRMPISEIEGAFRKIQGGKHIGKIVVEAEPSVQVKALPAKPKAPDFDKNSTYLIVGGFGGLGRAICRWMVGLGARNLIILSRSGPVTESAQKLLSELEEAGVKILALKCDISNFSDLHDTMLAWEEEMPRVRGVIHGGMDLKDLAFENMTNEDFKQALRPKVDGSQKLQSVMSDEPLDFFIMLSSCAGIGGNIGQANYAAGCTYQDALARSQASQGVTAFHSLDLGVIEGAGYASENLDVNTIKRLASRGLTIIKLEEVFAILSYAIRTPSSSATSSQIVCGISFPNHDPSAAANCALALDAKFSHLISPLNDPQTATKKDDSTAALFRDLEEASSQAMVEDAFCKAIITKMSNVLALPTDEISPDRSMMSYGGDSLIAVELRNWLVRDLQADVQIDDVLGLPSIKELAAKTAKKSELSRGVVKE
ncbi:hypothetical protein ACLMJK_001212 [Lecanora helva]